MANEQLYMVSAFMTEAEITERRDRADLSGFVELVSFTKHGGDRYTESDIGLMIWAAAEALEIEGEEEWDAYEFAGSLLPLRMKAEVMEEVNNVWWPGNDNCCAEWLGNTETALAFFDKVPEFRNFRTMTAEEMGQAWESRQPVSK